MKRALIALAILVVALGGWCTVRRLFADDEAAIRAAIEDMRTAAEAKDVGRFMSHVSGDYQDDSQNNAFIIRQMIMRVLTGFDSLKVHVEDVRVTVTGDTAYATMNVTTEAVRNGKLENPFGSDQAPERPRVTFKKDGEWKIVKVDGVQGSY